MINGNVREKADDKKFINVLFDQSFLIIPYFQPNVFILLAFIYLINLSRDHK